MRYSISFILLTVLLAGLTSTEAITLAWDASSGAEGYRLYYGQTSGQYDTVLDTGVATSAAIAGLTIGETYYFAVTAFHAGVESEFSNEVSAVIQGDTIPEAITDLRVITP